MAGQRNSPLIIGRISGLFGVKGWVKVHSYADPREAILNYKRWLLERDGDWQEASLEEGRKHGKTVIARLKGIADRDEAARLVGIDVGILRDDLPQTEAGEYYWSDLEGMQVLRGNGESLGVVDYLLATGANDVLVVKGEEEILIPFVIDDVIKDVDIDGGIIKVDWEWD